MTNKRIQNISECNPYLSASKLRAKLISENQLIPSVDTIRRRLYEDGRHGRVACHLPYVIKANLAKRVIFYHEHVMKSSAFWNRILWTDESMIKMNYSHSKMHV